MADITTELEVLDQIVDVLGGQSGQYETVVPVLQQIKELLASGITDPESIAAAVAAWLDEHPEATTTVQDGSITFAKLAQTVRDTLTTLEGSVTNDRSLMFDGLHVENSTEYSGYSTLKTPVFIPKGATCAVTNDGNATCAVNVIYETDGNVALVSSGFPVGATVRFVAADNIVTIQTYSANGSVNAHTIDVAPLYLDSQVDELDGRFMAVNLFDPDAEGVQAGWMTANASATINESTSYSTSDFIPVEVGKTYSYPAAVSLYGTSSAARVLYFNSSKTCIGYTSGTLDAETNILTFTVPYRVWGTSSYEYDLAYVRFSYANSQKNTIMFVEGAQPSEYVGYGDRKLASAYGLNQKQKDEVVELVGDSVSPLYGKKIAYNGDSICESRLNESSPAYNGGAYAKLIADATGCTYENRAISGGILASQTGNGSTSARYVVSDVQNMAADADLVCFEGGINDYWTNVPLGTYSESDYTGTLDTTTICGALESIFRQATAKWVGKPICFVIVHKITSTVYTQNSAGYTFSDAREKMLGICAKYAIPVFDAFAESGLNGYNGVQNTNFLTANANGTPDGCHPNAAGYRSFYVPQLIALLESLVVRD